MAQKGIASSFKRGALVAIILFAIIVFYVMGGAKYVTLDSLKMHLTMLENWHVSQPIGVKVLFAIIYVVVTALSLPFAAVLTLLGGALFGVFWGLVLASVASTIGATLAMLAARYVLQESVQKRFPSILKKINKGFEQEGGFYIFALRMAPVFPFFVVNLVLGLVPVPVRTYALASWLGMLPGTAVYVYAGMALADIKSLEDIFTLPVILAFALLALLPLAVNKFLKLRA